jgi:hypothetical protein
MHWAESPDYVDPPDLESPIKKNELQIHRTGTSNVQKVLLGPSELEQEHTLATDGRWDFSASYIDEATNHGVPATESIGLDRDAPKPPKLVDVGDWVTGSTAPGRRVTWQAPDPSSDLESGICGYVVRFDTSATAELHFGTDDATISKSFPIPAGLPEGTNYFHVSASSCAGVLSDSVDAELTVDTKPPAIELSGLLEPGLWSNSAQTASIDATDDNTGVESVGISLDGGVTTWTSGPNTTFVVPDGRHEVTAYARDEAGNQSSIKQWVRTDTHAPSVDIPTLSADDPALVAATVGDTASGLASAAIEMRRVDQSADSVERQWKALEGAEPITRGSTAPITIQRRIDDSLFAAGSYELRVAATDVAGNSTVEGDFALRSLQLPVRRAAELSAAVAEVRKVCRTAAGKACASASRCAKKLRCRTVSVVDRDHAKASVVGSWQDRYWLVGDALDAAGRPIANAQVVVSSTIGEGDAAPVGSATTDSLGRYGIAVPAGPTRVMTARIAGSNSQQPATATAKINVRADARFSPSARTVRSGRSINLAGRVLHPEFLPVGGVSVSVQWLSPNGWTAFVNPVSTDAQGKFSHIYRWAPRKQKYSVKLRALVQPVAGWPFASGSSDAVKIRVQPAG